MALFIGLTLLVPAGYSGIGVSGRAALGLTVFNATCTFFFILLSALLANLSFSKIRGRLMEENRGLADLATLDSLTGLELRRIAGTKHRPPVAAAFAGRNPLCRSANHIDDFKQVNDTYGHNGGGQVLLQAGCPDAPDAVQRIPLGR